MTVKSWVVAIVKRCVSGRAIASMLIISQSPCCTLRIPNECKSCPCRSVIVDSRHTQSSGKCRRTEKVAADRFRFVEEESNRLLEEMQGKLSTKLVGEPVCDVHGSEYTHLMNATRET
jgi:hypothetical protein